MIFQQQQQKLALASNQNQNSQNQNNSNLNNNPNRDHPYQFASVNKKPGLGGGKGGMNPKIMSYMMEYYNKKKQLYPDGV